MDRYIWSPDADAAALDAADVSDTSSHTVADDVDADSVPPLTECSGDDAPSPPPATERSSRGSISSPPSTESDTDDEVVSTRWKSTPTSSSAASSSDASFRPHYRLRGPLRAPQFDTVARAAGYSDADHQRFDRLLRLQHTLRLHDVGFTAMRVRAPNPQPAEDQPSSGPPPPNVITPADAAAIPSLRTWVEFRRRFTAPSAPQVCNPLMEVVVQRVHSGITGVIAKREKITVYRCISSHLNMPETLLELMFSHMPHGQVTPMALVADGVADLAAGMPSRGKCYAMFLRPFSKVLPQSPKWLIPILASLGNDNSTTLGPLFEQIQLADIIQQIQRATYGTPPRTSIILCFIADYPGCTAILHMLTPARQYPVTPGRVPAWVAFICHHCGIPPSALYHIERGRLYNRKLSYNKDADRPFYPMTRVGIHARLVFYDIVHFVVVAATALVADIGIFYYRLSGSRLHPIAAVVHSLFPSLMWDPFLTAPTSRSKERKSRKPFARVDPAILWSWLVDATEQGTWFELLAAHQVPLDVPVEPRLTPATLWAEFLRVCDSVCRGNEAGIRQHAIVLEDGWRVLNAFASPVPAEVVCADPSVASSFYPPVVGYGPASHLGFCSTWRFVEWLDEAMPSWRESGMSLPKLAATVSLEHAMKQKRADYSAFGVATVPKRHKALALLNRSVERFCLGIVSAASAPADGNEPEPGAGSGKAEPSRPKYVNRAYADIPLSENIPLHVLPVWAAVRPKYDDE